MNRHRFGLEVFAVEARSAQLVWSHLPTGPVRVDWPGGSVVVDGDERPGAVEVDGLAVGERSTISVRVPGVARPIELSVVTEADPPGAELARFATISDLHLGVDHFGVTGRLRPSGVVGGQPSEPHPVRCARAALAEAEAWGAQRIVVKGDVVSRTSDRTWALANDVLASTSLPVDLIPGNHDLDPRPGADGFEVAARHGVTLRQGVSWIDLPGIRLVLGDTTVPGHREGNVAGIQDDVCAAVAQAAGAAMVLVHHQPQAFAIPVHLPRGIPGPEATRFATAVHAANPAVIASSGHTHRNRSSTVGGVRWTEVGSVKDHPGVWAGYVVHEGGIRQVVRRVAQPDCIAWTEYSKRAACWAWGVWSPGRLADRSFVHRWPEPRRGRPGQRDEASDTTSRI